MAEIVAVLHDIRSVHNVGSIFRTADAAGVAKVYCCGITPAPLDRFKNVRVDFAKVALGAEKFVAWEHAKNISEVITALKESGFTVFAIEQSRHSIPYNMVRQAHHARRRGARIALVLGNEVEGLPPAVLKLADKTLEIPMHGAMVRQAHHPRRSGVGKESLNVAVAFGVVVFRLRE